MFGVRQHLLRLASRRWHCGRLPKLLKEKLALSELRQLHLTREQQYFYCVYFFDHCLPAELKAHRHYFTQEGRGFGEDAFHAMWFLLFQEIRPGRALEIGVYRGQTITLWKLLSLHFGFECQVGCVSPFDSTGDSVSKYGRQVDYFEDTQENHRHFNLAMPEICAHFSTDPEARDFITRREWDVIYIDGNHDYEVARQDWELCRRAVALRGVIVMDDAALDTEYRPPNFATAGHPGPSRLAREIDRGQFEEIFAAGHNRIFQRIQ